MRELGENDLSGYLPPEVLTKLAPHLPRLSEVARDPYDIAHSQRYHGARAAMFVREVARQLGMVDRDAWIAERAAEVHDLGYSVAEAGIVDYREHAYASFAVALMLTEDEEIARAALLHNCDVLPTDATPAERLLRDIDRTLMLGAEGAVRWAISHGLVSSGMTRDQWLASGQLDDLFDPRMPWTVTIYTEITSQGGAKDLEIAGYKVPDGLPMFTHIIGHDYEWRAEEFFWRHIVYWLSSQGLLERFLDFEKQARKWFWGKGATLENPNGPPWQVEPIMRDIQDLLHLKLRFEVGWELQRQGLFTAMSQGLGYRGKWDWVVKKQEAELRGELPPAEIVRGMSGQPVYRQIGEIREELS